MEIEYDNPNMWGFTALAYIACMIALWKMTIFDTTGGVSLTKYKIIISIVLAPVLFLVINAVLGRDN